MTAVVTHTHFGNKTEERDLSASPVSSVSMKSSLYTIQRMSQLPLQCLSIDFFDSYLKVGKRMFKIVVSNYHRDKLLF